MDKIAKVSSTEFAGKFGQWAMKAQRGPVRVENNKTGAVVGYFVAEEDFATFLRVRDALPKALYAWEMDDDLVVELEKPLPRNYRE